MAKASDRLVTVFGGSGFVGRHVVRALVQRGYRVRAAVRRPDLAGHLQPLGAVGQIHAVQANIRVDESIRTAIEGSDAVVNLVGILYETGKQTFDTVQAQAPGAIAEAARDIGVADFVQMSAIGADAQSDSAYARSKAAGEAGVLEKKPGAVIIRPSIVFGPEDDFFNRFAAMARTSPALPLIGGGMTMFQPVYVGDVAEAVALAIDGRAMRGSTYELGGPEVRNFKGLMELMLDVIGRTRLLIPVPWAMAKVMAAVMGMMPKPTLTSDQLRLLKHDNVVSIEAINDVRTLQGLGITPQSMETILPTYLRRFRRTGEYE